MARKKKKKSLGLISSLLVLFATFIGRRILSKSYTKIMGQKPPKLKDPEQPIGKVLTWTALSTISMALIETLAQKYLGKKKL